MSLPVTSLPALLSPRKGLSSLGGSVSAMERAPFRGAAAAALLAGVSVGVSSELILFVCPICDNKFAADFSSSGPFRVFIWLLLLLPFGLLLFAGQMEVLFINIEPIRLSWRLLLAAQKLLRAAIFIRVLISF